MTLIFNHLLKMCIFTWFSECNHNICFKCNSKKFRNKCPSRHIIIEASFCNNCWIKMSPLPNAEILGITVLTPELIIDGSIN